MSPDAPISGLIHDADTGDAEFMVEDPLFNAIWLWSTHALAEIAGRIGEDPSPFVASARRIHHALLERLWDGERFRPRDLRSGRLLEPRTIQGLAPLLDPDLPLEIVDALVAEMASPHFRGSSGLAVASSDMLAPTFERRRYWRGPVWANLNWLLARALAQHARHEEAATLRRTTLGLVERAGMREYFDPVTGEGLGADDFSWTAAAVIDMLRA